MYGNSTLSRNMYRTCRCAIAEAPLMRKSLKSRLLEPNLDNSALRSRSKTLTLNRSRAQALGRRRCWLLLALQNSPPAPVMLFAGCATGPRRMHRAAVALQSVLLAAAVERGPWHRRVELELVAERCRHNAPVGSAASVRHLRRVQVAVQ